VELFRGTGSRPARFLKVCDKAIQGDVLAEKKNFVFAVEIVVEVGGGKVGSGGDFAHSGFGEAAGAEFAAGGTKDFEPPGLIPALEARGTHADRMALGIVRVNQK
jgi:hypothetical protein